MIASLGLWPIWVTRFPTRVWAISCSDMGWHQRQSANKARNGASSSGQPAGVDRRNHGTSRLFLDGTDSPQRNVGGTGAVEGVPLSTTRSRYKILPIVPRDGEGR